MIDGIIEGRKVFANTMKYIFVAISANFGNMFSMAGPSLILPFLPLLPKQILVTNLLQDLPSMALASDHVNEEWLKRPHRFQFPFILSFMIVFGLLSSIFDYTMFGILILKVKASEQLFQTAWFTESVISAVSLMLVLRTAGSVFLSRPGRQILFSALLVIAFTAALSYLPIGSLLGFRPIPLDIWPYIIGVVSVYILCGEILKYLFYRHRMF